MKFIPNVAVSVEVPAQSPSWKSLQFNIHDFASINGSKSDFFLTPEFSCNGHRWELQIYPRGCSQSYQGGENQALDGMVSIFLANRSKGGISATFEMKILNKLGGVIYNTKQLTNFYQPNGEQAHGWPNFCQRSQILDSFYNLLDDNGTFAIVFNMKEEGLKPFIPKNPCQNMVQKKFLDEETSDVCFEVGSDDVAKVRSKRKMSKESVKFHAHILILQMCAPMLAALFAPENDGESATASITDVKPDIFRHLLCYVYGGSVPQDVLKRNAKEIIDTADKYSIVNLKLEAEAAYVESTDITMENAIDNLLYADAKNCALLKEAVLDFLAENSVEAAQNISFSDVPSHIINDLLVAVGRSKKSDVSGKNGDKYFTMRVSELRRMLDEKGLDVDGPREAMVQALKSNALQKMD